jgi:hypothetical protein
MGEGLHVMRQSALQLMNESWTWEGALKHKDKRPKKKEL